MNFAEQLHAELEDNTWPLEREREYRQIVTRRRAFRKGDKATLRAMAGFSDPSRAYMTMPTGKLIARTFGDFLYGETPTFAGADADQERIDEVVETNNFAAGLKRAVRLAVSEGEAWWKLHVNQAIADAPLVEWHSRLAAVPLFYGPRLLAVAFIAVIHTEDETDDEERPGRVVWRHAEIHADGVVMNVLYRGGDETIGRALPLETLEQTAALPDVWNHGLPILAGRVVNDIDEDTSLGESAFDQVEDLMLALNEALTISAENARLTGKDRVYAAGRLTRDGSFDAGIEVYTTEADGGTLGEDDGKPPIVAVEKRYDSESLWHHIAKLKAETLSSVGIVMQLVGEQTETGAAEAGVAIRLRFLPTINASEGLAAEFDPEVPQIVDRMLRLAALPPGTESVPGGFGWHYTGEMPTVERASALPADETEIVTTNATAVAAEIRSRFTAVRAQHPDWSDAQIEEEIARIESDHALPEAAPPDFPA